MVGCLVQTLIAAATSSGGRGFEPPRTSVAATMQTVQLLSLTAGVSSASSPAALAVCVSTGPNDTCKAWPDLAQHLTIDDL